MSLFDELRPASYKGAFFFISVARTSGGRKDVKKSFPNSDRQAIEDLGLSPRAFSIEGVIAERQDNTGNVIQTYQEMRDALLAALEDGQTGTLVHPFFGDIENLSARETYTLVEDMTDIGVATISMRFEPSDSTGRPTEATNVLGNVITKNTELTEAVNSNIAENYEVTTTATGNFQSALDKANEIVDKVRDATNTFSAKADQINAFSSQLSDFATNITSLVLAPIEFADSITGLWNTIGGLYASVEATVGVYARLFGFGDDDVDIPQTTAGRIERKKNQDIINLAVQTLSLGFSYENAAQIEFETVDDIESIAIELEDQYQKVIDQDGHTPETRDALTDLRIITQAFFDEQKLTAKRVIDVRTNLTSVRLLTYQYYGSSENAEDLTELNETNDPTFIEGEVQVFSV